MKKKLYNPITKTYYEVDVKSTSTGKKGTIIGKWAKNNEDNKKQL